MKINIFLTNLGLYNENHLVGKWYTLPIADPAAALKEIGVENNTQYEEYFITDFEGAYRVNQYDDLGRLNEIAEALEDIEEGVDGLREMLSFIGYENFEHIDYLENDEEFFNNYLEGVDKYQLACMVFYGKYYPTHDYVRFDGYGNLESKDGWEVEKEILENAEDIINAYLEEVLA